jgi:hypothetical protein
MLAPQEELFTVTLIVIYCNDFDSYLGGNLQISCSTISFDESVYHSLSRQVTLMLCWFYRAAQILWK